MMRFRRWILITLVPVWLFTIVDTTGYFGLNSSLGPVVVAGLMSRGSRGVRVSMQAVEVSPLLRHFCIKGLNYRDAGTTELKVRDLCGGMDPFGMLALKGGISLDRIKIAGLDMVYAPSEAKETSSNNMRLEALSVTVSDSRIRLKLESRSIILSNLIGGGAFINIPSRISGNFAGRFRLVGFKVIKHLIGENGRFQITGMTLDDRRISIDEFSVPGRVEGRINSSLPIGMGPLSAVLYKVLIPEYKDKGFSISGIRMNGVEGAITGTHGSLKIPFLGVRTVSFGKILINDVSSGLNMSATLLRGLNLDSVSLCSRQFKAVFSGASESAITAAIMDVSVVAWDVRGDFLRSTGLYPGANPTGFYSGVGKMEIQLIPLAIKAPKIHWVDQWSPIF